MIAELVPRAGELVVRLSPVEKAGGFHGDIRVPFPAVRRVSVVHDPWSMVRGLRAPGTEASRRFRCRPTRHCRMAPSAPRTWLARRG